MGQIIEGSLIGWEIEAAYTMTVDDMVAVMEKRVPGFKWDFDRKFLHSEFVKHCLLESGVKLQKVYQDGGFEGLICFEACTKPLPYGEEAFKNLELMLDVIRSIGGVSGKSTSAHTNVSVPGTKTWAGGYVRVKGVQEVLGRLGSTRDIVSANWPAYYKLPGLGEWVVSDDRHGFLGFLMGTRLDDVKISNMFMRGGVSAWAGGTGMVAALVLGRICESHSGGVNRYKCDGRDSFRYEIRMPGGIRVLNGRPERSMQLLRESAEMSMVALCDAWREYEEIVDGASVQRIEEIILGAIANVNKLADAYGNKMTRSVIGDMTFVKGKKKFKLERSYFTGCVDKDIHKLTDIMKVKVPLKNSSLAEYVWLKGMTFSQAAGLLKKYDGKKKKPVRKAKVKKVA
jgi:hypothetical protein